MTLKNQFKFDGLFEKSINNISHYNDFSNHSSYKRGIGVTDTRNNLENIFEPLITSDFNKDI